ncbi:MAG: RNA polymerase sigma factor [Bacteroidetes bacterium]|nr:RNA polymerase sigma factor [Bacteroidales bacterium]NJO68103.1 RNA polymerase sigma factor [Bacteroidota bacterium]
MTDEEIIKQILQGNRDAYRFLVEKHQSMIFRTCMGFLHDKDETEDLTQEVFIQAFQSLQKFKGSSSFSTWLYRIAVNASLNKIRKAKKSSLFQRLGFFHGNDQMKTFDIPIPENEIPENAFLLDEQKQMVQSALNSLPENQRTAIVLSKYDDLSQKEIAFIMNTSEGAVEALIQRAKANLREKLLSLSKKSIK